MFTGIITHTTPIIRSQDVGGGKTVTFKKPVDWKDLQLGESVSTNGICLTVALVSSDEYDCHLIPETLARTAFGVKLPTTVNLERSLQVNDRYGGHFVQGHVDSVGTVTKITKTNDWRASISFSPEFRELVIYKGSITINGVSLTVAETSENNLSVALIPHTLERTTLKSLRVGEKVNVEFDMIGKYIVNIMDTRIDYAASHKG